MPIWEWLLESAAVVLLLVLLLGVALVVRRRWLSRHGGTFELSYRARAVHARARLAARARPLRRRPARVVPDLLAVAAPEAGVGTRRRLTYVARREPEGVEQLSLYPGHVVIRCDTPTGDVELALGSSSLMGFQSWLEAGPPGAAQPPVTAAPVTSTDTGAPRPPRATRWRWRSPSTASASPPWPRGCPTCASRSTCPTAPWVPCCSSIAVGSMVGMPASGHLIERWGAGAVVRLGALVDLGGLVLAGVSATAGFVPGAALGPARLRLRHRHVGRRDERRGRRRRATARAQHHAALPRRAGRLGHLHRRGRRGAGRRRLGVPLAVHYTVVPAAGRRAAR